MKDKVTRFKSLEVCLKEIEPYVRQGNLLQTSKPFKKFGDLRPREIWANRLLCAAVNSERTTDKLTFTTDPSGGDGIIYEEGTGETFHTEHVMVPQAAPGQTPRYRSADPDCDW
jgi:hypothetical protein